MAQIGFIIAGIFDTDRSYEDYVTEYQEQIGQLERLVSEQEYKGLRLAATSAASGIQTSFVLPTWSPRYHLAAARRAFAEMRAAHDRLFNTLDAYLAWSNAYDAANSQQTILMQDTIQQRVAQQLALLERIWTARATMRTNSGNALQAAEELSNKYIRQPFAADAQDRTKQAYYDAAAERIRYNDLLNQIEGLDLATLYDQITANNLNAEQVRENLELGLAGLSVQQLRDRQELLGFDFTARIVDSITDVFQNAGQVVHICMALWGLDELERLSPIHHTGRLYGWYFPLAKALWPVWAGHPIDEVAELLGDGILQYLDKADTLLNVMERLLQEFDANAARTLVKFNLSFTRGADGLTQAVLSVPAYFRFQEVSAIYLKGVPSDVSTITAMVKEVRVAVLQQLDRTLKCTADLQNPEFGGMTFGSDGGISGEVPIFALERECLVCASAGNQPIVLSCHAGAVAFDVECIVRLAGFNNPGN